MMPSTAIKKALLTYVVLPVAVAGGIMLFGVWRESHGYAKGFAASEALVVAAREVNRVKQAEANNAARAEAAITINALLADNERLEAKLTENATAAAQDARRDVCSLGADSVRRIDEIR